MPRSRSCFTLTWLPRPWRAIPLALIAIFGVVGLIAVIGEIDGGLPRAGLSPFVSAMWLLATVVVAAMVITAIASAIDALKGRRALESHHPEVDACHLDRQRDSGNHAAHRSR